MASLDDELALFEQEISSIVSDAPSPHVNGKSGPSPPSLAPAPAVAAAPAPYVMVSAPSQPPAPNPSMFLPRGMMMPPTAAGLMMAPPPGMIRVPAGPGAAGLFMPPQLRAAPIVAPPMPPSIHASATFESKPQMYKEIVEEKAEPPPGPSQMKTQVLPADVELAEAKKAKDRNFQNSYIGAVSRGEKKMKRFIRCAGGQVWEDTSLAEWDPSDFRLFCGDLGNEVSDELLAKAFRKYPSFQKAKVVRDGRTNKSKGYGFVSFKSQEDFVRACREMDGKYVGNRPVKLRKSNWKDRSMEVVRKKQKQKAKLGMV